MSNKNSDELEMIMSLYRSGKIDGQQKDALIAALEKGEPDKTDKRGRINKSGRDMKKMVFRVMAKRRTEPAMIVNVLSAVSGVESVAYDESKTLATVIGDYDVDALIAVAKAADIRLRVRDIDINYVPPVPEDDDNDGAPNDDNTDKELEELDDELEELEKEFEQFDDDDDEEDEEDEEDDDDEDDDDEPDGVEVHIDDGKSFSEFLKGVSKMVSNVVDQSFQAARGAGKTIADFADNVVMKTYDLNRGGVVVKRNAETFSAPYEDMVVFVKIVTKNDVVKLREKTGDADKIKAQCESKLPKSVYATLCELLDSKFTGKYKYVGDGFVLKVSVKPSEE